ncbi:arginase family protein [Bosea sp. (in: a-proteobacteria)]|uniref:arginase family protein n=1 Tax=Bosea sp. (in: a-proteobacteria) TaxID=1871050 RepID=UPI00260DB300|nr:arginase family protein [Bosea sp. (in: a-proteobacteria)]MCO5091851.1 arginase family protein [Bosea sp. (in: a-proteobacteria)]
MTDQPQLSALYGATTDHATFLGLTRCERLEELSAPIAILGAPCATPYRTVGAYCRNAPDALRRATAALAFNIDRHDFDSDGQVFPDAARRAVDCGDVPFDEADSAGNRAAIRAAVSAILRKGAVPVLLGGDDSIPIPMLQAVGDRAQGRKFTILQIDAHIDWRPVHMDEEWGLSSTMRRASEMPHIERIVQVGARGIGTATTQDYNDARAWGVNFVTAERLHAEGLEAALSLIPEGSEVIVCIDADALDPAIIPGVIGRAPGGLSYYQALGLIRGAGRRGRIAAIDFVEFMPERDVDGLGAFTFARLITSALGVIARQAT